MNIWMLIVIGVLTMIISSMFRNARNQAPPFPRPRGGVDADVFIDEVPTASDVPPLIPSRRRVQPPPLPRARRVDTVESIPVAKLVPPRSTASKVLDAPTTILTETK